MKLCEKASRRRKQISLPGVVLEAMASRERYVSQVAGNGLGIKLVKSRPESSQHADLVPRQVWEKPEDAATGREAATSHGPGGPSAEGWKLPVVGDKKTRQGRPAGRPRARYFWNHNGKARSIIPCSSPSTDLDLAGMTFLDVKEYARRNGLGADELKYLFARRSQTRRRYVLVLGWTS